MTCFDQYRTFVAKPEDPEDPCELMFCPFHAGCIIDRESGQPLCKCLESCNLVLAPVCGSNNVTYTTECHLKLASCHLQKQIQVDHLGSCDIRDPCIDKRCPFGAQCVPSLDGLFATCQCPSICYKYPKTDSTEHTPVCGSDGKDYPNVCELQKASCIQMKDIVKKYDGKCDPCKGLNCSSEICMLNDLREPVCQCGNRCSRQFSPVCGSDGQTYHNECMMKLESCRSRRSLIKLFSGNCSTGTNPCENILCRANAICQVNYGKGECICAYNCESFFHPVCGNDRQTYDNECELRKHSCLTGISITISYFGFCSEQTPCDRRCTNGAVCVLMNGLLPSCICPVCLEDFDPVCGSNRVSYNNECQLKAEGCERQQSITILNRGLCNTCANVKCRHGAQCEQGRCVCNHICDDEFGEPVCASNGVTYANKCVMHQTACEQSIALEVVQTGECEDMSGSGGSGDWCEESTCRYGGICVPISTEYPEGCKCIFTCPAVRSVVCGSDGKTYGSECLMREMSCKTQKEIFEQPLNNCQEDMDEELCDGMDPLVNITTKVEYDCTDSWNICPSGSYCHKIPSSVARCCQEDGPISSCRDSEFGCCADSITAAPGLHQAGCPGFCRCNSLGSMSSTCDPVSRQCTCKPGVTGLRCDHCEVGYWGLTKIADGNRGCTPCDCNNLGSNRDICEQTTGRCVCVDGFTGHKCDLCINGNEPGPNGCNGGSTGALWSCDHIQCHHAVCQMRNGIPQCQCSTICAVAAAGDDNDKDSTAAVCGSNKQSFGSACQLKYFACRLQRNISVAYSEACSTLMTTKPPFTLDHRSTMTNLKSNVISVTIILGKELLSHRIPSFTERSYLQLTRNAHGNPNISVELSFIPKSMNGIIFYTGQSDNRKGDYMSLVLKDGFVEFRYELGSGPAHLRSKQQVTLNNQHQVLARRSVRDGFLKLDDNIEVFGTSRGSLVGLNLDSNPIYLGYVPADKDIMLRHVGTEVGFTGCLLSLRVSGSYVVAKDYDLTFPGSADIINGSLPVGKDSSCTCPEGREGQGCKRVLSATTREYANAVLFDRYTFHGYNNSIKKIQPSQLVNKYEIEFQTNAENGILLLLHKSSFVKDDYLAIAISYGHVEASLNLGKENPHKLFIIKSKKSVSDGHWHTLVFIRDKHRVELTVDGEKPVYSWLNHGAKQLDTDGILWIGGSVLVPNGLPIPYLTRFEGCVSSVKIDDKSLHLVEDRRTDGPIQFCNWP